jgi:hypothetical protein
MVLLRSTRLIYSPKKWLNPSNLVCFIGGELARKDVYPNKRLYLE